MSKLPLWVERENYKEQSRKQEERVAEEFNGKAQPGSGNQWHSKGDVSSEDFIIECKQTRHASFTLSLRDLKKIERFAKEKAKLPVFIIEFMGSGEYVVLRKEDFLDVRHLYN